jgi:hypothetical protein
MAIDYLSFTYAAIVAAGGTFGYVKSGEELILRLNKGLQLSQSL